MVDQNLVDGMDIPKELFKKNFHGEFVNAELDAFLKQHGIDFIPTHAYTPEENAVVEKMNGILVNKTRTAMQAADMPTQLWPEVLQYIVDIDNMSATKALNGMTSSEKLFGKKPDLTKVRVCGSVGFVYVPKRKNKLSPKAEPALLLGFAHTAPGYRLLHLRTGRIVEAKDVKFREDVTVSKKYLNALLVGQHRNYDYIPFVPLPVEFVAEENVHEEKASSMPSEATPQ
ncbi:Copia type Polyprotein [Phytophthora megakarya]|uniref:Copia type Polyprotein n=1 Tax=Phytophthora megakarya TaxID=4795 RepID=A0A225V7P3_9STRA|nr:Copia type Polyprotein [Phytophthora megakarya]